jgi:RsiW-degrading membrane proteinase PrsW (M82 family)
VLKIRVKNRKFNLRLSLQVLNLFLALLLSNFGSSSLSAPTADNETNKIAEAFNRIGRFKRWVKNKIIDALKFVKNKLTNQIASIQPAGEQCQHGQRVDVMLSLFPFFFIHSFFLLLFVYM